MPDSLVQFKLIIDRLCAHESAPLLMFDYDGTLAPFVVDRKRAFPYPFVRPLLEELRRATQARLVIVSGRAVSEVKRLLGLASPLEIWGSHGWERLTADGVMTTGAISAEAMQHLVALRRWLAGEGLAEQVEEKPASLALHWRGMLGRERHALELKVSNYWQELEGASHLEIHRFDGGFEWRLPGWSKADAVYALADETASGTPMAYFGDDLTDEDAFKALPKEGAAILVREESRPTAASVWMRPPDELQQFLQMLLSELRVRHRRA